MTLQQVNFTSSRLQLQNLFFTIREVDSAALDCLLNPLKTPPEQLRISCY